MNIEVDNNLAKETLIVLSYLEDKIIDKVPQELFQELNDLAADSDKEYYINREKKLEEQYISEECKSLISTIYYLFN